MSQTRPSEFIPPPECPVFEPSWEEFANPFSFINKIRPIAENSGICKIRPPQGWQPPFACDVDRLHFTPRIQRLNELEAQTRVRLNFLDQIAKFWELQGCTLKIPHVERKILDLYQLYTLVKDEGGFESVCKERRWTKISLKMGFAPGKAIGSHLRAHYERILYPYHLFQAGANLMNAQKPTLTNDTKDKEYKPHDLPQRQSVQPVETCTVARRAKPDSEASCLQRGVKMESDEICVDKPNLRRRMGSYVDFPGWCVEQYMCLACGGGGEEDRLLLCDGCDDSYHTFCLIPPLHDVPKGDWRCPKCLAQECGKPQVAFGFEQAPRDYTLQSFGDMADSFKSDYFNMPVHMVPTELVEKEFWRLVSTIEEDVTVEYGADIASKDFGSGFPVKNGSYTVTPEEEHYLTCGWNLNNMPVMEASVLTHVTADICGMKLPWLYVGMCFSSFCWHIEDHWSYSINYLHWGEPKTWYGAPGHAAEQLEAVMMKLAPELFESQPDLLHQLVTIMNPNVLMAHGVPIFRTNQCAGEFVITFPRSYHSGFNQGFNFAEAVNFCTLDWMPLGRQCIDHYRSLNRYCVFSHDEMVCHMVSKADGLDLELASAVQKDMLVMIEKESQLRERGYKLGLWQSQKVDYDVLPDEERQCAKCRTTCYLSAVTCPCSPGKLVCLHHAQDLCSCPVGNCTLNYKFTLPELSSMLTVVTLRAESYDDWTTHVREMLEAKHDQKKDLDEFRSRIAESERKMFPDSELLHHLRLVTQEAEKSAAVAQQLLNGKRQTRYRSGGGKCQNQLSVEELRSFVTQLYNQPCQIRQAPLLKELLEQVVDFQHCCEQTLVQDLVDSATLQAMLDRGSGFDVELPELSMLRERLQQTRWVEAVQEACDQPASLTLDCMRRLIDQGVGLAPHPCVEKSMARLQELLTICEHWEEKADNLLKDRPRPSLETLELAVQEVENIPAYLSNYLLLKDSVSGAKDWLKEAVALQHGGRVPVLAMLSDLVTRARTIPVWLEPVARLENLVWEVETWKENAAKTFLLRNSSYSLLEVLCPRCEVGMGPQRSRSKKVKDLSQHNRKSPVKLECLTDVERALSDSKDSASAMATLSEVRVKELDGFSILRTSNDNKFHPSQDCSSLRVCLCHRAPSGPMLQCELCHDLYHSGCVPTPKDPLTGWPWLCSVCCRSEKPPLDKVLPLLAALQRIRVRLPEGDALRFVIERTVRWQNRVQQLFATWRLSNLQNWSLHSAAFYIEQPCISLEGLEDLEVLMVEGLLLPVTLPEIQQLHQALLTRLSSTPPSSPNSLTSGHCDHQYYASPEKSPPHTNGLVSEIFLAPRKEPAICGDKNTKRRLEKEVSEAPVRDKVKKPKKKKPKTMKEKSRDGRNSASPQQTALETSCSDDSEDEFARCAFQLCQKPEGNAVNWVQCDGRCNQWFHQICVGLSAEQAEKEDYICANCFSNDSD
uniref:[histone H3]-trimethyl-L-lysine(4) demethylase n=1 Tax=Denticeps clupeoides TaxID=299321 RepID=A0AAY4EY34_9TELE